MVFAIDTLPVGDHSLNAGYGGDENFYPSASVPVTLAVAGNVSRLYLPNLRFMSMGNMND